MGTTAQDEAVWYVWWNVKNEAYGEDTLQRLTQFKIYRKDLYMRGNKHTTRYRYIMEYGGECVDLVNNEEPEEASAL